MFASKLVEIDWGTILTPALAFSVWVWELSLKGGRCCNPGCNRQTLIEILFLDSSFFVLNHWKHILILLLDDPSWSGQWQAARWEIWWSRNCKSEIINIFLIISQRSNELSGPLAVSAADAVHCEQFHFQNLSGKSVIGIWVPLG